MWDSAAAQQKLKDRGQDIKVDGDFGPKSYAALMAWVADKPAPTPLMLQLGTACARHFPEAEINSPLRIAHNFAQACVETAKFKSLTENLNYNPAGLLKTFPGRISTADAQKLGRQPGEAAPSPDRQAAIANLVYGGAFGRRQLGNTEPGDGFRFRGRGWKQTTGRFNYGEVRRLTGLDVVSNPDQLTQPDMGVRAGCLFWAAKGCNALADEDDVEKLTVRVNGGTNGLDERRAALARARLVLL